MHLVPKLAAGARPHGVHATRARPRPVLPPSPTCWTLKFTTSPPLTRCVRPLASSAVSGLEHVRGASCEPGARAFRAGAPRALRGSGAGWSRRRMRAHAARPTRLSPRTPHRPPSAHVRVMAPIRQEPCRSIHSRQGSLVASTRRGSFMWPWDRLHTQIWSLRRRRGTRCRRRRRCRQHPGRRRLRAAAGLIAARAITDTPRQ